MSKPLKAGRLSVILFAVLGVLIAGLIGGSVFAASKIISKSTDATHKQIDAEVSADDPSQLEELKTYLTNNAAAVDQTAALAQTIGNYDQNTIVATVTKYATTAGVSIGKFEFDQGTSAATGAAGTTGTTGVVATPPVSTSTTNGGTFGITLNSPIRYRSFLVFLRLLENGVMPATVTNAIITADPESPMTNVTVTSLTVKVGA